jgi:D-alanine-D-alanine ligase
MELFVKMRVAIVHNAVAVDSAPDAQDVLVQVAAVREAIEGLGHDCTTFDCSLDLASIKRRLKQTCPDVVFNLVESLDEQGRLLHLFPSLLDAMSIPYTGSPSRALLTTTHKVMAKEIMALAGLRTPIWIGPIPRECSILSQYHSRIAAQDASCWIVKSVWEHASFGLDEDGLLTNVTGKDIEKELKARASGLGGACFAEAFVDGREFNISLLAGSQGPQILPPAEILFEDFDPGKPRIVGYRAKWEEDSYEYHHTPRRFDFSEKDDTLLKQLTDDAVQCWKLFGLRGYARIDFRVDVNGLPWILEVNANPCLSPDAGFAAAVVRAGLTFQSAIEQVLADGQKFSECFY